MTLCKLGFIMDQYVSVRNIRCLSEESPQYQKSAESVKHGYVMSGKAHLVPSVNQASLWTGTAKNCNNPTMLVEVFRVKFQQCL
jgi:hypothetical protein